MPGDKSSSDQKSVNPVRDSETKNRLLSKILDEKKHEKQDFVLINLPLQEPLSETISAGHLTKAINLLRLQKDEAQGIKSYYTRINDPETKIDSLVLYRDATNAIDQNDTYHDWAILGINYASAAINLLKAHDISPDIVDQLSLGVFADLSGFVENIKKSSDPEISLGLYIHEKLIPSIIKAIDKIPDPVKKELTEKRIKAKLAKVRDFNNFSHENLCVATKMKINDKTLLQVDFPLGGHLPKKLDNEYTAIATEKDQKADEYKIVYSTSPDKSLDNEDSESKVVGKLDAKDIPWYSKQEKYLKNLIKGSAEEIRSGAVLPTQSRGNIVGARNLGEEFILEVKNDKSFKIIQHHYHSGTPAHLLKEGSQSATNESIKQLKTITNAQHMLVLSLLSPLSRLTEDSNLVNQIDKAVKAVNKEISTGKGTIHFSNIPLNGFRSIVSNQMEGVDWLIGEARSCLENCDEDESKNLANDSLERNNLVALLESFEKLKSGSRFKWDAENRNLQLVSVIQRLAHAVNEARKITNPKDKEPFVAIVTACQSGKDRAGLARIKTMIDSVLQYFKISSNKRAFEETATKVINAGQVAAQAGHKGGTLGVGGLKSDTISALPSSWSRWKKTLFKKTASYNKGIPKDPRKLKWYRNKKTLLSLGLLGVGGALCATGVGAIVGAPILMGSIIGGVVGAVPVWALGTGIGVGAASVLGGVGYSVDIAKKSYRISDYYEKESKIRSSHLTTSPLSPSSSSAGMLTSFTVNTGTSSAVSATRVRNINEIITDIENANTILDLFKVDSLIPNLQNIVIGPMVKKKLMDNQILISDTNKQEIMAFKKNINDHYSEDHVPQVITEILEQIEKLIPSKTKTSAPKNAPASSVQGTRPS